MRSRIILLVVGITLLGVISIETSWRVALLVWPVQIVLWLLLFRRIDKEVERAYRQGRVDELSQTVSSLWIERLGYRQGRRDDP